MRPFVGMRVGAVLQADGASVFLFGYGTYAGEAVPDLATGFVATAMRMAGARTARLLMDDGRTIYGCECWWAEEAALRGVIGAREVLAVDIDELRAKHGGHGCA